AVDALSRAGMPVMPISTVEGTGLDDLRETLFDLLPPRPEPISATPAPTRRVRVPEVKHDMSGLGWVVTGTEIESVVARFDPSNRDAVAYLQHHFKSLGIDKLLRRAGARTGDEVHIGAATFDYLDENAVVDDHGSDVGDAAQDDDATWFDAEDEAATAESESSPTEDDV